ncbi:2'-5' RNA ligase family protein [Actinokineospora sp. NBRC 105648]|uniref:2'-5' RNA ligase family protein n=1 Tax=Actinokineospora sp. NBRC 105648 TaxID=3032206 RepID=UPI0024A601B2|nr:2'-5' RNA ligase family protein [Actinokineospora sp. NBRC 105648]GLZ40102.1 RNA 2',3'-cyclic phosphodiesterase [Actinokineospora sp. NBRC 105648]
MTRLFAAFTLPGEVADHLERHLPPTDLRPTPRTRWHITLAYYGEDDPDLRLERLSRLAGHPAPRLRLHGSGTFERVCLLVVTTPDRVILDDLAEAAEYRLGGYPQYRPHVTVARGDDPGKMAADLRDYRGPEWTPEEIALLRGDPGPTAPVYSPVGRVRLAGQPGC